MGGDGRTGGLKERARGKGFLSKDFIKFVTVDLVSWSLDNRYRMQAYMRGYTTNINNYVPIRYEIPGP